MTVQYLMEPYSGPTGPEGVSKVRGAKILSSRKFENFSMKIASVGLYKANKTIKV